jgi:site-specific DNA recombinase
VISLKGSAGGTTSAHEIPWSARNTEPFARLDDSGSERKPNPQVMQAIVRAHAWLELLIDGTHNSIESLARAVDLHPKVIRSRIPLAFLEPQLSRALLTGTKKSPSNLKDLTSSIQLSWHQHQI